jgi:hypothetical protein
MCSTFHATTVYPQGFESDHTEKLKGKDGEVFSVPGTTLIFKTWQGKKMVNDWRKVPVEYKGKAMFAELAIALMLIKVGWSARWVEVY